MKMLAIDDYAPILKLYEVAFKQQCHVETAKNFIEVKDVENKESFNLIITDYNFPDISFDDLFTYIKENFKETKIIVISGTEKIMDIKEKYCNDCIAILSKPVDLHYIMNMIENI